MAAYEFKNFFDSDLWLAYSLMDRYIVMAPENEECLYHFTIFLLKMGKLHYARGITARPLRIDKDNRDYQEIFVQITFTIEKERGSFFYLSIENH